MAGAGVPRGPIPPMPGMGPMSPIAGAMGVPGGYLIFKCKTFK